ncbi:MAG: M28 family metallopeptidase [Nocardioides sp.]
MIRPPAVAAALALALTAGCTAQQSVSEPPSKLPSMSPSVGVTTPGASPTGPVPKPTPSGPPPDERGTFDASAAMADVRLLASEIGPRLATGPAFRRAGRVVRTRLSGLGYRVSFQRFPVPAGDSWGVPVKAGSSFNVVGVPPGLDPGEPHRLVGAHLDTVAVAPGAEDNASGVAVLLELARLAASTLSGEPQLPTVFVAFGAEEPRGAGDDMHHFGSRHYVATMPARQAGSLRAMVSLDRVGVGRVVPVCTGPLDDGRVQANVLRAARRVDVPTQPCENTASDHWSFEKAGLPAVRLGSTSYAAYHSAADVPAVVSPIQLGRTGRLAWAWLRSWLRG